MPKPRFVLARGAARGRALKRRRSPSRCASNKTVIVEIEALFTKAHLIHEDLEMGKQSYAALSARSPFAPIGGSAQPMMEWTDAHYRQLARLISKHTWLYTEMVVDKTLIHQAPKCVLSAGDMTRLQPA